MKAYPINQNQEILREQRLSKVLNIKADDKNQKLGKFVFNKFKKSLNFFSFL